MNSSLLKTILPAWIIALMIFGCSGSNTPKNAASEFLNSFNEKNYEKARKYATPETIKLVDLMESLSKMSTSIDSIPHNKIEVLSEKIDGESATVVFREEGSEETEELKLKKIDGKWLVHITKTDINAKDNSVFNTEEEGLLMEPDTDSDSTEAVPAN